MGIFSNDTERARQMEELAKQLGYSYEIKDSYGVKAYFKDMKLFRQGGAQKSLNMMQRKGDEFDSFGIFDYHYTISTGKSSHTFKQTVYFRIQNDLMLPEFRLFPEKWHHQVRKWFGMQDINFIEYPQFSRNYLLQGPQPEFIWKLFQEERLIEHFRTNADWSVEAVGKYFVMYEANTVQPLREIRKFIKTGDKLYNLLVDRNNRLEALLKGDS